MSLMIFDKKFQRVPRLALSMSDRATFCNKVACYVVPELWPGRFLPDLKPLGGRALPSLKGNGGQIVPGLKRTRRLGTTRSQGLKHPVAKRLGGRVVYYPAERIA
ncbi:hypothetical protein Fot_13662 [Forsythia ovata]|uniref:Ribosomal protein L15 n=1 Tax=Forsythia ovata TaxID=205694 RepID=A0ABD1W443_9LAMI